MNRSVLWIFGIISISFLFWWCSFAEAQASPHQAGAEDNISRQSSSTSKIVKVKNRQSVPVIKIDVNELQSPNETD